MLLLPHLARDVVRVNVTAYTSFSSRREPLHEVFNEIADKLKKAEDRGEEERARSLQGYLDNLEALWKGGEEQVRVRFPNWQVDAFLHDADDHDADELVSKVSLRLVGLVCVVQEPERVVVQRRRPASPVPHPQAYGEHRRYRAGREVGRGLCLW